MHFPILLINLKLSQVKAMAVGLRTWRRLPGIRTILWAQVSWGTTLPLLKPSVSLHKQWTLAMKVDSTRTRTTLMMTFWRRGPLRFSVLTRRRPILANRTPTPSLVVAITITKIKPETATTMQEIILLLLVSRPKRPLPPDNKGFNSKRVVSNLQMQAETLLQLPLLPHLHPHCRR